jgi:hypothetical protein
MSLELMQSEEGVVMGECKSYLEAIFCRNVISKNYLQAAENGFQI